MSLLITPAQAALDRAWVASELGDVPHRNIAADRIIAALPENLTGYLAEKVASSAAELAAVREGLGFRWRALGGMSDG